MIHEQNVTLIVSTCNLIEKGVNKCERFWPEKDMVKLIFSYDELRVTVIEEKNITQFLDIRKLSFESPDG